MKNFSLYTKRPARNKSGVFRLLLPPYPMEKRGMWMPTIVIIRSDKKNGADVNIPRSIA